MSGRPLSRRHLLGAGLLTLATPVIGQALPELPNPLIPQRADPHVLRHTDGWLYLMATVPAYDRLELRRARSLAGLATAEAQVVWRRHEQGPMSRHIWAPELHVWLKGNRQWPGAWTLSKIRESADDGMRRLRDIESRLARVGEVSREEEQFRQKRRAAIRACEDMVAS